MRTRAFAGAVAVLMVFASVGVALVGATPSAAQQPAESVPIGVVDFQGIMRASQAAKTIHSQIEIRRDAYQEQVSAEERHLRQAEQELAQQRAVLEPDDYQDKVRQFQARVAEVQRKVQLRKRELDETFAQAMDEVRKALVSVVAEIAERRGLKIVLFKNQIVIAEKSLDISDETLKRLDERLPNVMVDLPPMQ